MVATSQKLFTAKELAGYLNISLAYIRKLTRTSDIPRLRLGRTVRFDPEEVLAWFRAQQQGGGR